MTRRWLLVFAVTAVFAHPALAPAQIDFDSLRDGTAGCPELAADPNVGSLAAFLCQPVDRTNLDLPINQTGNKFWEVRAGSFSPLTRPSLAAAARPSIGDEEFYRLQNLLIGGQVLSRTQDAYRTALLADGDEAGAEAILGTPETSFDANIPMLLQARADSDRLAFLRSGILHSLGAVDTLGHYEQALGQTLVATIGGLPQVIVDGSAVYSADSAKNRANPFFLGPDGVRDTADDLPYVARNERAQQAGYFLAPPIAGTVADRFDATFGTNSATNRRRDLYVVTAQIDVPSASFPGTTKLVELYGVYSQDYLTNRGCGDVEGAVYNRLTGQCLRAGEDVSAEAIARGCNVIERTDQSANIGTNADGDCIEINTTSPGSSQLQFEVIGLLGDLNVRPPHALNEPADMTDIRAVADGGLNNTLPARPRSGESGNVSFPAATASFRRNVDPSTGAPYVSGGTQCHIRTNEDGLAIGPNGLPGDGDDSIPSAGDCLLWGTSDGAGAQGLLPTYVIASTHSVNQTLFHTLCTLSFDPDDGFCALDHQNHPLTFGFTSYVLAGLGVLGAVVLDGVETIQETNVDGSSDVIQRGSSLVLSQMLLAIEPLALQTSSLQDLGASLRAGQASLLGCGVGYASPCSLNQQAQWLSDPAIFAGLARDPQLGTSRLGGIDLMNADASVVTQEFATEKYLRSGTLVGTTALGGGQLAYLPGLNFSRNGQRGMNVDASFTRQGVQIGAPVGANSIESGAYLPLTPTEVNALGAVGRAEYQIQPGNLREADGWTEPMPWAVNQEMLDKFGAIVFRADPQNPLDLDSPLNRWNLIDPSQDPNDLAVLAYSDIDGEYCARWMTAGSAEIATPFNLGCTALETVSANLERWKISGEIIGQDRVFDPPESLQELVAMLDGDPSNDATGDPIAGPDGIFARNQFVISDEQADFEVVAALPNGDSTFVIVPVGNGEDPKEAADAFLRNYDPNVSCPTDWCYLEVNNVLVDPDDARPEGRSLILAMPIAFLVDTFVAVDPNDPDSEFTPTGFSRKVNLAALQYFDLPMLRRLLASQIVAIETPFGPEFVGMSLSQRDQLLGAFGSQFQRGRDMDGDNSADLDRNRDAVWDGQDDYLPGPISDDNVLCGSGIPGDILQDGVQYRPYRADQAPGSDAFNTLFPEGLPPRSPVFCRELTALLGLIGPLPDAIPGESDAFLWHGGQGDPGTDDDADGSPDVLDNCPATANPSQTDVDSEGVGDTCDNCREFSNPRVADDFLSTHPWATLTGGQRDDDRDGFGNLCDADFTPTGASVGPGDLTEYRASIGKNRGDDTCGSSGARPCAIFDLDEASECIGPDDLTRFRELNGKRPGPKCTSCPLVCESGEPGGCD